VLAQLRHGFREVGDHLFRARELHDQIAVAGDLEGRHRYFRA
jgi:hypothetical protein